VPSVGSSPTRSQSCMWRRRGRSSRSPQNYGVSPLLCCRWPSWSRLRPITVTAATIKGSPVGGGRNHLQNLGEQHLLQLQLQCPSPPSYKDVFLRQGALGHKGCLSLSSSVEGNAAAQKPKFSKDGWQVMKSKCPRPYTTEAVSDARRQQEWHSLFLRKMKGLYFLS
jgi:hypothetical protein